jgi:hypothetical protein
LILMEEKDRDPVQWMERTRFWEKNNELQGWEGSLCK